MPNVASPLLSHSFIPTTRGPHNKVIILDVPADEMPVLRHLRIYGKVYFASPCWTSASVVP